VWIERVFVEPPERVEDELPATQVENIGADDLAQPGRQEQPTPLDYPKCGVV
jgi:hypothetical protein